MSITIIIIIIIITIVVSIFFSIPPIHPILPYIKRKTSFQTEASDHWDLGFRACRVWGLLGLSALGFEVGLRLAVKTGSWIEREMGFPKIGGTILGVPRIRTIVFWGSSWGPLI